MGHNVSAANKYNNDMKDKIKQIADSPPCCSPSIFRYQSIEKHVKSLLDIFKNLIKSPTNKHSIGE